MVEEWWSSVLKGDYVGNTLVCISTQVPKGQDGVEVKSMVDLVLVKDMLHYVHVRGWDETSQITMYSVKLD